MSADRYEIMNAYEKIRAALELAESYMAGALREEREKYAGRESISDAGSIAADIEANKAALSALAELEKAASEPVRWCYEYLYDGEWFNNWRDLAPEGGKNIRDITPLYAAPPVPAASFTAREIEDAYMNGHQDRNLCNSSAVFDWINSAAYKLIQERVA